MKKYNVFWILIDSARNFQTNEDDRGLPASVENFSKEALFFRNTVTSATSTIQSISSMMTSTPSYLLSRSYNNFQGLASEFDYFPLILKKYFYNVYGAVYFKHGREIMSEMFGEKTIDKSLFPEGLTHRKEVWNNLDIYNLFLNILNKNEWENPTMCYLHYNVRVDDNISNIIEKTINSLKEKELYEDSIIIINSDHGYPFPSRNWNPKIAKKNGWGHDQLMYNDCILTPFIIRYPNCKPKVVNDFVATIDIVPTILKILGIKNTYKFHGNDLLTGNNIKRIFRTDNRYIGQLPSYTSYIYGQNKCIIYRNKKSNIKSEYYNLSIDKEELNPIEYNKSFKELNLMIDENNKKHNLFHYSLLLKSWFDLKNENKKLNICIFINSTQEFIQIIKNIFKELYPLSKIDYIIDDRGNFSKINYDIKYIIIESEIPWDINLLLKKAKKIKGKKTIYLDNNGKIYYNFIKFKLYKNFFNSRRKWIYNDKLYIIDLISRLIFKKLLKPIK